LYHVRKASFEGDQPLELSTQGELGGESIPARKGWERKPQIKRGGWHPTCKKKRAGSSKNWKQRADTVEEHGGNRGKALATMSEADQKGEKNREKRQLGIAETGEEIVEGGHPVTHQKEWAVAVP